MSVWDKNLDAVLEQSVDDGSNVYSHGTGDSHIRKSNKYSNGNARKKIEEYQEELMLKKLTKGVFED